VIFLELVFYTTIIHGALRNRVCAPHVSRKNNAAHGLLQFAISNWAFLDAAILSAHAKPQHETEPVLVHVTFVDWIPGICSLLGMLVVNLIDKDRVRGEDGFGDSRAVWRARLFLFVSFALMAGGLAGSVVSDLLETSSLSLSCPTRATDACRTDHL
jgi:hypothetical protein